MSTAVAFVLKGYPRLSESFIAQEILALKKRGLDIRLFSLRYPTDELRHPVHREIGGTTTNPPFQEKPSRINILGLLDGLSVINGMVDSWLSEKASPAKQSLVKQKT